MPLLTIVNLKVTSQVGFPIVSRLQIIERHFSGSTKISDFSGVHERLERLVEWRDSNCISNKKVSRSYKITN